MEPEKVSKLISLIDTLVSDLHKNRAMKVHARINQFYYMQKVTELQVLHDQLEIAQKHFQAKQEIFESTYREISTRWCEDARWLNHYAIGKLPEETQSGSGPLISKSVLF